MMDMTWKPEYEEKYKAMGFSAEKISGIRYGYEEMVESFGGWTKAMQNTKWDR